MKVRIREHTRRASHKRVIEGRVFATGLGDDRWTEIRGHVITNITELLWNLDGKKVRITIEEVI